VAKQAPKVNPRNPQAVDDFFSATGTSLTEDSVAAVLLDVLGNDLGNGHVPIASLGDGNGTANRSAGGATLSIASDGEVTYDAATFYGAFRAQLQSLAQGEFLSDTFVYVTRSGSPATVTVQIAGTNDGPVITSGAQSGSVKEDGTLIATGQVTASDVDHGDHQHYAVVGGGAGAFGSLAVDASTGAWTYTLDNAAANVQALAAGEHRTESFSVRVTDDHGASVDQEVVIDVAGSAELPRSLIAIATSGTNVVTLTGDGAGLSAPRSDSTGAFGSSAVAIADLNGDGKNDLVIADAGANRFSILLGDGAGGFAPATTVALGGNPTGLGVGDMNGDGHPDIVLSSVTTSTVFVFRNTGTGGFLPASVAGTGTHPGSLALGDVDGDGDLDAVTGNFGGNSVSVLKGDGAAHLGGRTDYSSGGAFTMYVTLGDVNNDGNLDIAVANLNGTVGVLRGDGAGGFGPAQVFACGAGTQVVQLGDMNEDGNLDIVTANAGAGQESVGVLLGDGAGGFAPALQFAVGGDNPSPFGLALGDANGDGHLDALVANAFGHNLAVFAGDGTGGLLTPDYIATGGSNLTAVAFGLL